MVGLRERGTRPNYASLAVGGDPFDDGVGGEIEGAPGSTPGSPINGEGKSDSASLSSGDGSNFQPDEEESRKGKGKGDPLFLTADEEMMSDEDEDGDGSDSTGTAVTEVGDPLVELAPTISSIKRERVTHAYAPKFTHKHHRKTLGLHVMESATPRRSAVNSTDPPVLPLAYREIIKASSEYLTKPPENAGKYSNAKDRDRYFGREGYACGPPTPFTTRLTSDPRATPPAPPPLTPGDGRGVRTSVEWVWDAADVDVRRDARRDRSWMLDRYTTHLPPWQAWEGEGYWQGMYEPAETVGASGSGSRQNGTSNRKGKGKEQGKGKELPDHKGWRLREEVTLGLENVGRHKLPELEFLSRQQAVPYLPVSGSVTCHIGPHSAQKPIALHTFSSKPLRESDTGKDGFIFSAGGPIWGLDFCPSPSSAPTQYLAASTLAHIDERPIVGGRVPRDTKGSVQIWSFTPGYSDATQQGGKPNEGMRCEILLCLEGGGGMDLKFMPVGARDEGFDEGPMDPTRLPKLGILALVQRDGTIAFYSVPHPRALASVRATGGQAGELPIFLKLSEPLLRLEVADAICTCIDWLTGDRLAAGLSNGHVAIWDVGQALREGVQDVLPVAYIPISLAAIRSIAVSHFPPGDPEGEPDYTGTPSFVAVGSYDGTFAMVDIRDPGDILELNRQRTPALAIAWADQLASPIYANVDHTIELQKPFGGGKYRTHALAGHRGPVWSIASSHYHTMLVSASSDGSAIVSNFQAGYHKKRKLPLVFRRLFEMDFDFHLNRSRMLDDFLPETMTLSQASDRSSAKFQKQAINDPSLISTPLWYPHIGVHKVTWHNTGGLRNAGWLAAGTASGLGRVEWVDGRWTYGMVPVDVLGERPVRTG